MKSVISKKVLASLGLAVCAAVAAPMAAAVSPQQAAPAFQLPSSGGGVISLADLAGQVVYLDFWASWCGPCRESFPWMNELQAKYAARGLRIVAVNVDAKQSDAQKFLTDIPAQFAVAFDPKGQLPAAYGIKGMPTSYLIGADGKIFAVHQGFHAADRAELEAHVEAALKARAGAAR